MIVQAKDASNADFTIPDETPVDFSLDANGELYGNFIAPDGSQAKSLADITYGDARAGNVKYIANGAQPSALQPINITVTKSTDSDVSGMGTLFLKGVCVIPPPRYAQGGFNPRPTWADSIYDHTSEKIAKLGCALSSQAMMMTAFGDTLNPGELNSWMKDPVRAKNLPEGGYQGTKVSWYAPGKHSGGNITIDFTNDFYTAEFDENPSNPSVLDSRLAQCKLIIVMVKNTQSTNCTQNGCEHWVLVTGKQGNEYTIRDSGRGEQFLSGYGSFWSWRAFAKSN